MCWVGQVFCQNFWDDPPSLPLSESATHCKLNKRCPFLSAHVFWFLVWLLFLWFDQKNKRKQTERKVACGNKIEFLFKKLSTYFQLHNMQNTQHKSYDPNVSQVRIREWRRMCCKIENCKRTCTCTRVNPTPRHMWCNDNRRKSNSLIAEKKGNSKLEVSEINRLHN